MQINTFRAIVKMYSNASLAAETKEHEVETYLDVGGAYSIVIEGEEVYVVSSDIIFLTLFYSGYLTNSFYIGSIL